MIVQQTLTCHVPSVQEIQSIGHSMRLPLDTASEPIFFRQNEQICLHGQIRHATDVSQINQDIFPPYLKTIYILKKIKGVNLSE